MEIERTQMGRRLHANDEPSVSVGKEIGERIAPLSPDYRRLRSEAEFLMQDADRLSPR